MSDESSIDSSDQQITSEDDLSDERTIGDPKKKGNVVPTNEKRKLGHENNASTVQPGKKLQAKWDEMFGRLLEYKTEHGHCLVPNRYAKDPQLGSWVSTQRRHYKILTSGSGDTTPMTPARARKLEEIGFKWSTKDPRHVPWEHRYNQLVAFKEKYGHSQVPIGWEENIKLSNWVSTQRQEYKLIQAGRQSRLSDDKISRLDDIDFIWEAQRGGPRRNRKATVAVPSKPNPVDARKIKIKAATRGGKAGASGRGGSVSARQTDESARKQVRSVSENGEVEDKQESIRPNQLPIQQQQSHPVNSASMTVLNGGAGASALIQSAYIPALMQAGFSSMRIPGLQLATNPWQTLHNGAFQSNIPHSAGLAGSQFFPLATQVQMAQPGYQFGGPATDPSRQMQQAALSQFSSLQHQPQAVSLIMAPASAYHRSMGIQNLQPFQLPHLYLQGNVPHQQAQAPNQNVHRFPSDQVER